jgi:hypothetical protein
MENTTQPVPANYLQPHPSPKRASPSPGSPPLSAASTMLTPSPPTAQVGVWHSRSASSPSYSERVRGQHGQGQDGSGVGVYHSRSVSSSGVSPGTGTGTMGTGYAGTEGGWEAGSYR